jgi:hypothetical protein
MGVFHFGLRHVPCPTSLAEETSKRRQVEQFFMGVIQSGA